MYLFHYLILLFSFFVYTNSAGVAVHLNVASRLKINLLSPLQDYEEYYYAGAFHPDAFYHCFGESLAAETSHWPPFLKAAVDYYHDTYSSKGLSNDPLKAFIYGIFTHQVTDISWHSLQSYQGLIRMISELDFDGNYQNAHTYIDTVGDFIHLNKDFENLSDDDLVSLLNFYQSGWNYPSKDIVQIYRILGFKDITETKLNICMKRGFSALQGEVSTILADRTTDHKLNVNLQTSPLSFIVLNDYYYGGIDQILNVLTECINQLDTWFLISTSLNPWTICNGIFKEHPIELAGSYNDILNRTIITPSNLEPIFKSHPNVFFSFEYSFSNIFMHKGDNTLYLSSGMQNSQFGSFIKVGNFLGEPTMAISAPYEEQDGSVYLIPLSKIIQQDTLILENHIFNSNSGYIKINSTKLYSYNVDSSKNTPYHYPTKFGDKMFTWNLAEFELLVISEPGLSHFKIFLYGSLVAILKSEKTQLELGMNGVKQWNILSQDQHDINNDGWYDMVIGSMYSDDFNSRFQSGLVIILDGKKIYQIIKTHISSMLMLSPSPIEIDIGSVILQTYNLPKALYQNNQYEQFGTTFAASNNKVFIGINSVGGVAVFDKYSTKYLGLLINSEPIFIPADTTEIEIPHRRSSEKTLLYSFHGILTGTLNGIEWVIVSSAAHSYDGMCPLCGLAYLYILEDAGSFNLVTKLVPTKIFKDPLSKSNKFFLALFSSYMHKISDSLILLGSNYYGDGRGALFLVDLNDIIPFNKVKNEYTQTRLYYEGNKNIGFTNFGYNCIEHFNYGGQNYVAVSLANYLYPQFINDDKKLMGSVAILELKL